MDDVSGDLSYPGPSKALKVVGTQRVTHSVVTVLPKSDVRTVGVTGRRCARWRHIGGGQRVWL